MFNTDKIKKSINTHKTPLLAAGGMVVGLAMGCQIGKAVKLANLRNLIAEPNALLNACEESGLQMFALTPAEAAKAGLRALAAE